MILVITHTLAAMAGASIAYVIFSVIVAGNGLGEG